MKFRSDEDGYITALRFYKQPNNTGTHVGHLWSGTGQLLAAPPSRTRPPSGWQRVELPNPVAITKDTTYIASYYAARAATASSRASSPRAWTAADERAARRLDGGNGVYRYGASGLPRPELQCNELLGRREFERTIPPDTRGPTVTDMSPGSGRHGRRARDHRVRHLRRAAAPATVNASNFTLRDEDGDAVAGAVTYDAQTKGREAHARRRSPRPRRYTARQGRRGGVTDAAGNPLATDKVWSFTVSGQSPAEGPGGPIQIISAPDDPLRPLLRRRSCAAEGLNEFDATDGPVTADKLAGHSMVLLASPSVTDAEVALLTNWVQAAAT